MPRTQRQKQNKIKTDKIPEPYARKELKIKDPTRPNETYYVIRYKGDFTRDAVQKFTQEKSNAVKRDSPGSTIFSVSLKYGNHLYRSGKRTKPGDPVNLWDPSDSDVSIDGFEITGFDILVTLAK